MTGGGTPSRRSRPPGRLLAAGAALLAVVATCAVVVALRGGDDPPAGRTVALTIPAGTKARLDRGDRTAEIPDRIEGRVGDTLRIVNRDRALHVVGGFPVAAGQTFQIPLRRAGVTTAQCSAHPDGTLAIVVRPA